MAKQTIRFQRQRSDADRRTKQAEKFVRVLKLLELLQGHRRWTPRTLARELACSEREVYRGLNVLALAGIYYEFDRKSGAYEPLTPDYRFPSPLALTADDLMGQATAAAIVAAPALQAGTGAAETTRKLAARDAATAEVLATAEQVIAVLGLKMVDHSGHGEIIRTIQRSLIERKQLWGSYVSPYSGRQWDVTLHPYRLCLARQAWYLIARANDETAPRNLRVVRFKELCLLDQPADGADGFDLRAHLGNAWDIFRSDETYDVEIRFTKEAAAQVTETRWHQTQNATRHADGGLTLTFRVDGLDEIVWWLLPWAGFAEVVRPIALRERLVEQLEAGLSMNRLASSQKPQA